MIKRCWETDVVKPGLAILMCWADLKAPFPDIGIIREGQKVEGPGAQIASYGHEDPGTPGLFLTTH